MGLPGLLCAKLAAQHVLLTDYEPMVVALIQQNAELNAVAARCACLALDWFNLAPLAPEQRHVFDLLLLADVIYAAAVVGPLVATLCTLLRPRTGACVWQGRLGGGHVERAAAAHMLGCKCTQRPAGRSTGRQPRPANALTPLDCLQAWRWWRTESGGR